MLREPRGGLAPGKPPPNTARIPMARIQVLVAHPQLEHSRIARRMAQAVKSAADGGAGIELRDLYARYPDYLIDVAADQAALADTELMVWLHLLKQLTLPGLYQRLKLTYLLVLNDFSLLVTLVTRTLSPHLLALFQFKFLMQT